MKVLTLMICTYKRKEGLKRTLDSILKLDFNLDKITVVVVDNDPNGSGEDIKNQYKGKIDMVYAVEKNPGIANARNRCLNIAKTIESKFVSFIDDDEIICSKWLNEFLKVMNKTNADIITGPVYRIYPKKTPKWIIKSKVFEPMPLEDMVELDKCGSGNVFMKKEIIYDAIFDTKYGLTGGEDTKFFMQLKKLNKKIVYSKHAIAFEYLGIARVNYRYLVKRTFRESSYYVHIEREVLGVTFINRLIKSIAKIILSILILPISLFGGVKNLIKTIFKVVMGCGEIYGLLSDNLIRGY